MYSINLLIKIIFICWNSKHYIYIQDENLTKPKLTLFIKSTKILTEAYQKSFVAGLPIAYTSKPISRNSACGRIFLPSKINAGLDITS